MSETTLSARAAAARRRIGLDAAWRPALRSPLVLLLAAVLVVQIIAALLLGGGHGMAPAAGDTPLLALDMEAVSAIEVASGEGDDTVRLERSGDDWVLPGLDGFPAGGSRVDALLDNLADLKRPLPVATSADARRRFRVAEDAFERRLTLRGDGGEAVLFLGDSPGFRRIFARAEGEEAIYDLRLALFDLGATPDDWIDRGRLQFDRGEITRVGTVDWALVRGEDGWSLAGSDAELDTAAVDGLVNAVAAVGYTGVLRPDSDLSYDLDDPARVLTIEHDGKSRRYRLAPIADSEDYVLKRDAEPYVYRLSTFDAQTLLETDRARLLGEGPEDDAGDGGADAGTAGALQTPPAAPAQPAAERPPAGETSPTQSDSETAVQDTGAAPADAAGRVEPPAKPAAAPAADAGERAQAPAAAPAEQRTPKTSEPASKPAAAEPDAEPPATTKRAANPGLARPAQEDTAEAAD